jgi:tetratricopeptide (TPR) repeat protein
MTRTALIVAAVAATVATSMAQTPARDALARGKAAWDQRLAKTAIAALETAARDRSTAAEAHELLGRIYTFKGWQQDNVFPGFHDEPSYRAKAIAELKAAVAADPSRPSAQDALKTAEGFAVADKVDPAPPRPEIRALDQKIAAGREAKVPIADVVAAIDERIKAQADPAPYFAGAQVLIDRGDYDRAIALAERGVAASDRFIDENLSAYQMSGKAEGSRTRSRAQAADLTGWALFMKKDLAKAEPKLEEAERLSRGLDGNNQMHLADLARAQNAPDRAREHDLNVLSLAGTFGGAPQPVRDRAKQALSANYRGSEPFEAWLDTQLATRGEARKNAALKSLVDKKLPKLTLTTIDGKPFDTASLRGKVLLLNFFASW